ncbi:PIG-L deacetylase family protein [Aquabacterium sp.]|uniref:PIG-L deacetylase family protein n=1 Tax=Aquabacterium sp. TaxID=1872578 RepID=UPI003782FCC8
MKRFIKAWRERGAAAVPVPPAAETLAADALCALPAALPVADARRVMVLAPHPDDETIGCGGLLLQLAAARVPTRVVLVSDGAGAGGLPPGADEVRYAEFRAALARLGQPDQVWLRLPDGALAEAPTLAACIEAEVRGFQPHWLLAPAADDLHRDHRAVAEAARRAACAVGAVDWLLHYETWAPLALTHVLDITAELPAKLQALRCHETALACGNYLPAAEGLARYRALMLGHPVPEGAAEGYRCRERSTEFR